MINTNDVDGDIRSFRDKIQSKVYPLAPAVDDFQLYVKNGNPLLPNGVDDKELLEIVLNPDHPHRGNLVLEKRRIPKIASTKTISSDANSWFNTLLFRRDEKLKKSLRVYDYEDNSFLVEVLGDVTTTRDNIYKRILPQYPGLDYSELRLYYRNTDLLQQSIDDITLDEICVNPDHPDRSNLVCGKRLDSQQQRQRSPSVGNAKTSVGKKAMAIIVFLN